MADTPVDPELYVMAIAHARGLLSLPTPVKQATYALSTRNSRLRNFLWH